MTIQEAREKLTALQQKMAAFEHASSLIFYDGATAAPKGSQWNGAALTKPIKRHTATGR